ncbi:multidrug effflux MFS transporter [Motiliproteus sp. MSK22-1]|uniref:multidrug effflux MFS transporter n=1 Tax=Motiliproteus sp. MSK22-1 TaxID=1897630 RepID=UPI001E512077|nr:multidrug effflux MFS transporter [Motiliproteus sp. MSK22-1]
MTKGSTLSLAEFVSLFALMISLTALSIDAILPAYAAIGQSLALSNLNDTHLIITMLIVGMAAGELFFGPLSDSIGRKKAILIGITIYCLGTSTAMAADSLHQLLIGRVIQGIGLSGPKIASRALIRDQYSGDAMARIMSFIMMIFILVPMLAPAFGQLILLVMDWRGIFYVFLLHGIIVAIWFSWRQPETLPVSKRRPFSVPYLYRSSVSVLKHKQVMAYTLIAGLIFGMQLAYYNTSQAIFQDLYQTGTLFPLYFAVLAMGIGIASLTNGKLVMRYGMFFLTRSALIGLIISSTLLLVVTQLYNGIPPFLCFMGLCFLMLFCVGIIFGNINAMAMQSLGHIAGLGASLIASVSSLVAALVSVIAGRFYNDTLIPLAVGFGACSFAALMLALYAERKNQDGSTDQT